MIVNLIIIAAVLTLAGAFMWLKPSPRDRHLNRLRSKALAEGFKLQSVRLSDTSVEGRVNDAHVLQTLYQLKHDFDKETPPYFTVQRTTGVSSAFLPDGWKWADKHRPPEAVTERLSDFLTQLPERYFVVDARPDGVGLAWEERGGVDELPAIRETLERLIKLLSA